MEMKTSNHDEEATIERWNKLRAMLALAGGLIMEQRWRVPRHTKFAPTSSPAF